MNNFAPVLICTLNRYEHFKRCIESLSACTYADKTDLFIAIDYPSQDEHFDGHKKIMEYIPCIKGFNAVTVFEREYNYGTEKNYTTLTEAVFAKYDRAIISEDDNVFSVSFLDFINGGLCKFIKDPLVIAICGYKFPFEVPESFPHKYYYSKGFSGWGFGIWRNKYIAHEWTDNSIMEINKYLHNPWKAMHLNSYQYGLYDGMMHIVKSGKFTGDRMYCFSNLIKGTYSIFPTVSKVRNTGHDGSGVNSTKMEGSKNIFVNQLIDPETTFNYAMHNEYENKMIGDAFRKHILKYNYQRLHHKLNLIVNYLIYLIKN